LFSPAPPPAILGVRACGQTATPITFLLTGSWLVESEVPVWKADVRVVAWVPFGVDTIETEYAAKYFVEGTSGGFSDLDLPPGQRYHLCVTAVNAAGVASDEVCSAGVQVGTVEVPVTPDASTVAILRWVPVCRWLRAPAVARPAQ
jgi:hypothetical protein